LNIDVSKIKKIEDIVFLPISFFKTNQIKSIDNTVETTFMSSGTGGNRSKHAVFSLGLYEFAFLKSFENFFSSPTHYCHLALLPNYVAQGHSSLVYMVNNFITKSPYVNSQFILDDFDELKRVLIYNKQNAIPTILWGVSFSLLDFIEENTIEFPNLIVIETGGMKGKRKEIIRKELHTKLKNGFKGATICSEYGMTELLSQSYFMPENDCFKPSPLQKILIRDINDPFKILGRNKHGAINVIDLANWQSCSFIATEDLGIKKENGFDILGRMDLAENRGCNLLFS